MTYHNFAQMFAEAQKTGVVDVVLQNEMHLTDSSEKDVYERLARRWQVMQSSIQKALSHPQQMPGGLITGAAGKQQAYCEKGQSFCGAGINRVMALALSGSEVNASMGRICAAPTAGACGVLPAVLTVTAESVNADEKQILDALLVAGGVGAVVTKNATVSGAEGGCQAECGTAAAMAAAAAVQLVASDTKVMGNAIALAFINCMGLVCDPVAGLVQLPCAFRNASQAVNAMLSADLALAGQQPHITADEAVESMYKVGRRLPYELRETALGGIASTATARKIEKELQA